MMLNMIPCTIEYMPFDVYPLIALLMVNANVLNRSIGFDNPIQGMNPKTVGYQGVVDKVSTFYTKFLAQPWQTLFKDFINCVFEKKDVIQYPRFTKLIIAYLMKKFSSIPQRLYEDYHSIKDDISVEYETVFVGVEVPTNQPQPVVSTKGTHRTTPNAHMSPTLTTSLRGKQRKKGSRETSSPGKSLKVAIRQKKQSKTSILPSNGDIERDEIVEATLLSLTLYKTTIVTEAQENVAKVQEKLAEEKIEKMVEGEEDEESYANTFADSMLNDDDDDDDFGTRI
nr:hypothetical protein [Tanacetum cinerariifolium]